MRRAAIILIGLLVLGAGAFFWLARNDREPSGPAYRTATLDRGEIARTVSATGRLEPVTTVDVGSTVSGPLIAVEVDFNDVVRAGQTLARIDPQSFRARVQQLEAALAQAEADAAVAKAEYDRYLRLGERGFASEQVLNQRKAAHEKALAQVSAATAQLDSARVDLGRTVIRSPVDGVVVDRRVDPGQSVAASFQAPTLFLIAQDLTRLQALISVDEADIGEVRVGQEVTFTVDAFPGEDFAARVAQIRQQGVETQGVVSYRVVVEAGNPDGRLLPGMTANAEILIERRANALRLPNAALRFRPADPQIAARADALSPGQGEAPARTGPAGDGGQGPGQGPGQGGGRALEALTAELELTPEQVEQARAAFREAMQNAPRPGPDATPEERRAAMRQVREQALKRLEPLLTEAQKAKLAALRAQRQGQRTQAAIVWVLKDGEPAPVRVRLGVADDSFTEVASGDLSETDQVVVGGGPRSDSGAWR